MKKALVLSGGAARGAFHLGVLAFFDDNDIKFDAFSGSSIGSLIASSYLSGVTPREQLEIFKSEEFKKNIKINPILSSFFKFDLSGDVTKKLVTIKRLEEFSKPLYLNTYNFKTKKLTYHHKGDTYRICQASCALPIFFPSVKIDSLKHVDGGIVDNLPITPFLDKNYTIVSIDLFPKRKKVIHKKSINPVKIIKRKIFKKWIENQDFAIEHSDIYITNEKLREYSLFSFKKLDELFEIGYQEASNYLHLLK